MYAQVLTLKFRFFKYYYLYILFFLGNYFDTNMNIIFPNKTNKQLKVHDSHNKV